MGAGIPKQFIKVCGHTILEYSVDAFESSPAIDEIAIVSNVAYIDRVQELVKTRGWKKVRKILDGGKERYDSSLAAINAYKGYREANLIIHDAVRPLVSAKIIEDVVEALAAHPAVEVAVPVVDTVIVNRGGVVQEIPDRSLLWRVQTPQAFRIEVISEAFRRALEDPDFKVTDDAGVVYRYMKEIPIQVVRGEESNIKLTYPDDLAVIENLIKSRNHEQ